MNTNYRLTIRYDGTKYRGWEHQPDTDMTIQGKIEHVLARMLELPEGEVPEVISAGRTDAGVHAENMIANVWMDTRKSPEQIRDYCNLYLPEDICIKEVAVAGERFHSRYNAIGKTYCYTLYLGECKPIFDRKYVWQPPLPLDVPAMREAALLLIGEHDFASFCGNARMKKSTVRTVDTIDFKREGDYLRITFHGNGFLQYMVRIITGTLVEVGQGKRTPESMTELLAAKDRKKAGATAPAKGLTMMKVDYH